MKMKGFSKVALLVVVLIGCSVLGVKLSVANEKKVYIFDDQLREVMVWEASKETGETIEDELPTVRQLEEIQEVSFMDVTSIEGLQYAKNTKLLTITNDDYSETKRTITDLRPIGELTQLESIMCYSFLTKEEPEQDISYMKNLNELKSLHLSNFPVLDITPLSGLKNLEYLVVNQAYPVSIDSIAVNSADRSCVMEQPVKYSTQFDNAVKTIECKDEKGNEFPDVHVETDGRKVSITNIPTDMNELFLQFHGYTEKSINADFIVKIPIFWY
ncbi:leucine-rich repeat domain-containing protein [Enterococcus pallens]|uniref:Leucine-rich repeat domain-containing protein n=1 Tax=Enterococcus pallens ATCC BAA-351 TaxID=1158607 RepID=R2Q150_9ENTE|nr:leucine-rich repeat domain-containing protein [Enterococcus pallens]EOH90292.1 hypothetical protein UAU_04121 [Enterococcus pallens ATCC BAA-351]EOU15102.1 hypothetical protein I588_04034 [Enterococcus pallens ATCC BAA-351]OJG79166.1 hypothetical protein RV10_GL000999 [Enterococcus pallens]